MSFVNWMGLVSVVLLLMALSAAYLKRLPVSSGMLYLALGLALGPLGLGLLNLNAIGSSNWLERVAEVVVLVSLFVGGLKLRLSPRDPAWLAAYRLAGPAMVLCIAGVWAAAHYGLGLGPLAALLLAAILAPTDPVLAGEVSVAEASDRDRLRYGLSGEAGLNDGAAFPFVYLALGAIEGGGFGPWLGGWALERVLWAVPAGLAIGFGLGHLVGRLAIFVRTRTRDSGPAAASDFLALALIGLSYWAAEGVHAWGFLAVFAAGLGLRRAEVLAIRAAPTPTPDLLTEEPPEELDPNQTPAEALVERKLSNEALQNPAVASGTLVRELLTFGETLERLLSVFIVILVGVLVSVHFDWRGVWLGLALLFVIRPVAAWLSLLGTPTDNRQRALMGWFGIRGIGSLYYLGYAIGEGIGLIRATDLSNIAITVVAVSVVLHGITVTPLLARYERDLEREPDPRPAVAGG